MEVAIWVIGIIAAVFIVAIYIITSVNKYSNSFVGKYFDEEKKTEDSKEITEDNPANKNETSNNETSNKEKISE
ncbi:MAG: hypothetical protein IPM38_13855 [Ignavibacteria bacterium]|nr:hypothetical protein [Ignavibacteria bacterium]